jgi:hypothetical protein
MPSTLYFFPSAPDDMSAPAGKVNFLDFMSPENAIIKAIMMGGYDLHCHKLKQYTRAYDRALEHGNGSVPAADFELAKTGIDRLKDGIHMFVVSGLNESVKLGNEKLRKDLNEPNGREKVMLYVVASLEMYSEIALKTLKPLTDMEGLDALKVSFLYVCKCVCVCVRVCVCVCVSNVAVQVITIFGLTV